INQKSYDDIISKINNRQLKTILCNTYKDDISLLLYQLNRFTAKNTKDYFIHKNLKRFLSEQLDYFIKAEVLDINTLEQEKFLDKHITRAKVVREIGEEIIDFLSQIEDFLKRLWEKKKFVLKTEYVITTDRIPEEFYDEIWKNKELKKEWKELGFDLPNNKNDLKTKKLPVDTKYFSQEFKERLLEKLTKNKDLDDLLDGILIKSENWQALNLLLNKYKEKVQTIYIDPPYNTGSDEFLYRDRYQHSSWLAMMENRLRIAIDLMKYDGVLFISIDDREVEKLKLLLINILGEEKFISQITRDIPDGTNLTTKGGVKISTEYILYFLNYKEPVLNKDLIKSIAYINIIKNFPSDYIETRLTKRGNKLQVIKFPKSIGEFDENLNIIKRKGEFINPNSKEKIKVFSGNLIIKNGILQQDVELEAEWSMP
ncbi:MAG: site-specific DNA-methyltransferase, partial [candidate division WOR-3 bacterium]|nr:site-specific DNA-methyltransferase [candidate division WOR-3 bacterium]